jgi:large repetitive protein
MVDFRRCIIAFAVLALFAGLAGAQGTPLACTSNATVTPALRGEGFTEQTGDIAIQCTGGTAPAAGAPLSNVNITVFYNTTVTSRLLPITASGSQTSNNTSEALLLINEPGSSINPGALQTLCSTPLTGCTTVASAGGPQIPVGSPGAGLLPNVYQGVVNANSVTFFGVPVQPPGTASSLVFRITNVRVNAQPLAGGSASGASPVQASIVISGATSLPIVNPSPIVGFVSPGLTASSATSQSNSNNLNQCSTTTKAAVAVLTFTENFGTAFKTRVLAQTNSSYAGQAIPTAGSVNNPPQNVPGAIYNSESNFVFPISSSQTAGLADYGTRLKATFNNVPAGIRIFVSTSNVNNAATFVPAPTIIGGSAANANNPTGYVGYAQLINGETTSDGNAGTAGFFPSVPNTDNGPSGGNVPIAEVSIANGTGTAVWEAVNTNPNTIESFKFAVYTTYVANVAQNTPLPGAATVNLSFAPTATSGVASSSLTVPRFAGDSVAARSLFTINICRTILLYPYITNQAGFDTGLTVANTTQDSFTTGSNATGAQAGACVFTWYGGTTAAPTTAPAPFNTGTIAAGATFANTVSTMAPGFQGYMWAVCNFQFAHGFAFISDVGARNLAMGYLAVVINDPGTGQRLNVNTTTSENGAH